MFDSDYIEKKFSYLGTDLLGQINSVSEIKTFPPHTELVRIGQFVKVIPIVLEGLVKVMTSFEDKEQFLYYIQPAQSCIMSFSSALHRDPSKIAAITETETTVLLIPSDKVARWVIEFPSINLLFYQQYELRYAELIDTINHLIYFKLDKRLFDYLQEKVHVTKQNPIKISHKDIANDLGTAREVVSRLVKKLEREGKLVQHHDSIELFLS